MILPGDIIDNTHEKSKYFKGDVQYIKPQVMKAILL